MKGTVLRNWSGVTAAPCTQIARSCTVEVDMSCRMRHQMDSRHAVQRGCAAEVTDHSKMLLPRFLCNPDNRAGSMPQSALDSAVDAHLGHFPSPDRVECRPLELLAEACELLVAVQLCTEGEAARPGED